MSIPSKPSMPHIRAIGAVLRAIPADLESDPSRSTARAMIVLEDAYFACKLGLSVGLTLEQVYQRHAELVAEMSAGQPTEPVH